MPNPLRLVWGLYAWLLLLAALLAAALLIALLPTRRARRQAARGAGHAYFRLAGLPLSVRGLEHLPAGPCIVVSNHTSYLDGPLLFTALPPRFGFVIKKEASRVPLMGALLRRLGHEFVDRFNRQEGARDARRILRTVATGNSIAFFPEGTFTLDPGLGRFHTGAFVTAVRAGVPVVPVAIRGAHRVLRAKTYWPRWSRLEVEALPPLPPHTGRDAVTTLRDLAHARLAAVLDPPAGPAAGVDREPTRP